MDVFTSSAASRRRAWPAGCVFEIERPGELTGLHGRQSGGATARTVRALLGLIDEARI